MKTWTRVAALALVTVSTTAGVPPAQERMLTILFAGSRGGELTPCG